MIQRAHRCCLSHHRARRAKRTTVSPWSGTKGPLRRRPVPPAAPCACRRPAGNAADRTAPPAPPASGTMPNSCRSGHVGAGHVVMLQHQQLVAGQRLAWHQLHDARLQSRQPHRHIHHPPIPAGLLQDVGEQLAESPDARAAELVDRAGGIRSRQCGHHSIGHVADIDRLESRIAADHRHDRQQARHRGEAVEQLRPPGRTPAMGAGSSPRGTPRAASAPRCPWSRHSGWQRPDRRRWPRCAPGARPRSPRQGAPPGRPPRHGCAGSRRIAARTGCPQC